MLKLFLASVIIVAGSNRVLASDVTFEDIVGRWCVSGIFDTFSKTQLLVQFPDGQNKTLEIANIEIKKNQINIHWAPFKPLNNTVYELSHDKRTLVQLPNTGGDRGPRRELHRC
jgi:hypothetical protein